MSYYYDKNPSSASQEIEVMVKINNQLYKFITDSGVFSKHGLDFGTRTLLEALNLDKIKGKVLDFGCGYGPIGIYISKNTGIVVDMLDINERSIRLSKKNARLNDVDVNIFASDKYSNVYSKYDFIITNPPIRVGKKVLYEILFKAKEYLNDNGQLWLVINKNQGAKTVIKDLENEYIVEVICKNKGFYVICATNH
ncbi:MAG: methyltransferase [Bacilli bacterium]|nr:methyltransferase [Bacilli bacterium]MDD4282426.1 methyltransferase [Bacilli bacterium]MDD4718896.1 methyltransferase [Bacilli bacterium]